MVGQAVVHLGCEPVNDYMAAPATHLVGLRARIRICRLPAAPSRHVIDVVEGSGNCGISVLMFTWNSARSRFASTPAAIREFAAGLGSEDEVVLDASGSVMAIARILRESNVGRVVVSDAAQTRAISHARVKSDRFDAAMLARLLSSGMLSEVWVPDEATLALRRRVARRAALIRARTRIKNQVHGVVMRCLLGRPPVSDLFGRKGRVWLAEQQLPEEETETVQGCLRQIDFLNGEIAQLDQ